MNGKTAPAERITPAEALQLFSYAKTEEMLRSKDLYEAYKEQNQLPAIWGVLESWDIMSLLSFVYDTGRVQGIREERARKRGL